MVGRRDDVFRRVAVAGMGGLTATPEPPPATALRRARLQQTYAEPEQTAAGLVLRVVVPVNSRDRLDPFRFWSLETLAGAGGGDAASAT